MVRFALGTGEHWLQSLVGRQDLGPLSMVLRITRSTGETLRLVGIPILPDAARSLLVGGIGASGFRVIHLVLAR